MYIDYEEYKKYINSDAWMERKKRYYRNKKRHCSACNKTGILHLHHKTYRKLGNEPDSHLIPLCEKCHNHVHKLARKLDIGMKTNNWSNGKYHLYNITEIIVNHVKSTRSKDWKKRKNKNRLTSYEKLSAKTSGKTLPDALFEKKYREKFKDKSLDIT